MEASRQLHRRRSPSVDLGNLTKGAEVIRSNMSAKLGAKVGVVLVTSKLFEIPKE
jgi:hypothetical protein